MLEGYNQKERFKDIQYYNILKDIGSKGGLESMYNVLNFNLLLVKTMNNSLI